MPAPDGVMTTDGIGSVGASGTNSLASSMTGWLLREPGTTLLPNLAVSMLMPPAAAGKLKAWATNPRTPASARAFLALRPTIELLSNIAPRPHLATRHFGGPGV